MLVVSDYERISHKMPIHADYAIKRKHEAADNVKGRRCRDYQLESRLRHQGTVFYGESDGRSRKRVLVNIIGEI